MFWGFVIVRGKTIEEDLKAKFDDKRLQFIAHGQGARGPHSYGFTLDFHSCIDPEESYYKVIDRQVDIVLHKQCNAWWPRLTSQPQKPPWLKIDFDKWRSQDMDDNEEEKRDVCQDYPDTYDWLQKEELGYRKEDLKKVYLIFYDLCQFVGYIYILAVMGIRYSRDGPESMRETYDAVGNPMKFIQLLRFLEAMHPLFGYTNGSTLVAFLQVSSRAFIVFCMMEAEPRMQEKPVVFYVFLIWSTAEMVRYLYYIVHLLNLEIPLLTWLRHTIWMPLYPLAFLCEDIIIIRNIPYFEETQKFTIGLPNAWNFAFHFPSFMKIYLLVLCLPGRYTLMSRMNHIRHKKLGKFNIKRKST
ncbi:very-long-chain (3R)-3-hydroxyacyl-CoA dehydratase isoform X2 [Cephus cinctus]|uniref:Very-long-chain (3R)-3-hydroxyacyl-CoA dehydratase n=1 Tax=Cephus cinctus TaxID=211228 RepID=A0AAJ7C471_CEPCN|nr:very-long-chain (3R)-3-hydroxyacyl-CoA dehydratase isoform X2 [Cephus cinctus]